MENQALTAKISVRGLKDSGSPLKEFKGKLSQYNAETIAIRPENQRPGGPTDRVRVNLGFTEPQIIFSTEPYILPIVQIGIAYSENKKSMWGYFGASLAKCIKEGEDIKDCIGRTLHMKWTPGHMLYSFEEKKDTPRDCWEVIAVEGGAAKVDPLTRVLELLTKDGGRTLHQFQQEVFTDLIVKLDANLMNSIMNGTLVPGLEAAGKVVKDDKGVYHLKK